MGGSSGGGVQIPPAQTIDQVEASHPLPQWIQAMIQAANQAQVNVPQQGQAPANGFGGPSIPLQPLASLTMPKAPSLPAPSQSVQSQMPSSMLLYSDKAGAAKVAPAGSFAHAGVVYDAQSNALGQQIGGGSSPSDSAPYKDSFMG